ncbi:YceI family protein [Flavobacterium sp. ANB]|uniref:YceI family protein n=1 Tax=unclassified Flavobacterium TaxID=196869 RepID=UPI0012BA16FF|nr:MULTISPECIES: YceI family protein [unclassified Flavobacterium]MBF4518606.1 YceI family protein [Flavobacterium sp. ANB]MTD67888.1 YceI family protein [Flavobacterium sp. LC2016-13]
MKAIKSILLTVIFITLSLQTNAQRNYSVAKSTFEVAGTSNVHDWVMKSTEGNGTANLTVIDSKLADINNLTITLPAESIKSSKTSMDDVAYETLDTKTYKNIKYVLKSANKLNETTWNLIGTYTIAGISKDYKTVVNVTAGNGIFILKGSNQITFADFGMSPPTAALGVVRAGKELSLIFNITLNDFSKNDNVLVIK